MFGWRTFANRRQIASAAGLVPVPSQSGESSREQGLSKAGNWRMRTMLTEIAWCWLRYQRQSALSRWYWERFGKSGLGARKCGLSALARKLLIALWRFVEDGVVPEGAVFKTPSQVRACRARSGFAINRGGALARECAS